MKNQYNLPGAITVPSANRNQSKANILANLSPCKIWIANDTGELIFTDKDNDPHILTPGAGLEGDLIAALVGTNGTPSAGNKYVTDSDPRLSNARAPTAHASSHAAGESDQVSPSSIGAEASANKGQANGYAPLDGGAKVPVANLPAAARVFIGLWNAATNTPTLADSTPPAISGGYYECNVAGSTDFGHGAIEFAVKQCAVYDYGLSRWVMSEAPDAVTSVDGQVGNVSLSGSYLGLHAKADTAETADESSSCSGNAATATKLATAAKINGIDFDGSGEISGAAKGIVDQIDFQDINSNISAETIVLRYNAKYAFTISNLSVIASNGTCTIAVNINGSPVTGLGAVSVSTVDAEATATAANSVAIGNKVELVISSPSGLNNIHGSIGIVRS